MSKWYTQWLRYRGPFQIESNKIEFLTFSFFFGIWNQVVAEWYWSGFNPSNRSLRYEFECEWMNSYLYVPDNSLRVYIYQQIGCDGQQQ